MRTRNGLLLSSLTALAALAVAPSGAGAAGGKVVFDCGANLCAVDGHGAHKRQLTHGGGNGVRRYSFASVSRDGRRMVLQGPDSQAYTADGNGRHLHALTDGSLPTYLPQIRPDGKQVLWTFSNSFGTYVVIKTFAGRDVYSDQIPDGVAGFAPAGKLFCDVEPNTLRVSVHPNQLVSDPCARVVAREAGGRPYFDWRPQFSPDGRYVLDAAGHDGGLNNDGIYLYRASSGARIRRLTARRGDNAPVFSPDGRTVLFDRGNDIWRVPAAGGRARRFLRNASHPSWSR